METAKQCIMVCVSASPTSRKLIQVANRLAQSESGRLVAVSVVSNRDRQGKTQRWRAILQNLDYAASLGAEIKVVNGHSIVGRLSEFARECGAQRIVVGRRQSAKRGIKQLCLFAKRMRRALPDTEIICIPSSAAIGEYRGDTKGSRLSLRDVGVSLGILAAVTLVSWWFDTLHFTDATLITVYIFGVLLISFLTSGYICGLASSLLSVLTFNYLFTVPVFSLKSYGTGYPVTLVIMFLAAFLTSSLTVQVKRQAQQHAQNAYRTEMLLDANRRLQRAMNEAEILSSAAEQVQRLLLRSVLLYPSGMGRLEPPIPVPMGETEEELLAAAGAANELRAVEWVRLNRMQGGATTGIFNDSSFLYLAVRINDEDEVYAVIGVRMGRNETIDPFDKNLLLAMLGECAAALEKERLRHSREEYAFKVKQEQLRSGLLRSISHDLRTPLTTISGNAGILLSDTAFSEDDKKQIYRDIYSDSVWLIDLVENLLSITRLDEGRIKITMQPQDVSDLLDTAFAHTRPRAGRHSIRLERPSRLLLVNADSALIVQLLVNLIENAFKYSGECGEIVVSAKGEGGYAVISVADNGAGVPDSEKEKIFEMLYTIGGSTTADGRRGLGLGLALCRTIAAAHGGSISVADNKPRGAVFEIKLPEMEGANE